MSEYFCSVNDNFIWFPVPKVATQSFEKTCNKSGYDLSVSKYQSLPEGFDRLFSFIIVRNPWERLVSAFNDKVVKQWKVEQNNKWRIKFYEKYKDMDFKEFVMSLDPETIQMENHIKPVVSLAPLKNITFVGRLETMWSDCDFIFKKIGVKYNKMEYTNSTTSWTPQTPYCKYDDKYDDETIDKVYELYQQDIDLLKYEFKEPS